MENNQHNKSHLCNEKISPNNFYPDFHFSKYIFILILIIFTFIIGFDKIKITYENKFFFEENQDKLNYCRNYGILVYDYYWRDRINLPNIGDYFQSLAALQYLPKNCKPYFVDRDNIQFYHGPKVKLIMNSWNELHEGNKYTSEQIEPIYVSYHLNNDNNLSSVYINKLKNYEPIGCRDMKSRDNLIKYKINAYFSSCLTTTLDIDYFSKKNKRKEEIIFIDYKFGDFPKADKFLLSIKAYNFKNITYIKHLFDSNLTHIERFKYAKQLLDRYAKAKLIITTRIHGALPCLAFNTPVILINQIYDYRRYTGLYELLNTIGINFENKFDIRVNINEKGLVYNSKKYLQYSNKLKEKLRNI